jgi:hypothetical protein
LYTAGGAVPGAEATLIFEQRLALPKETNGLSFLSAFECYVCPEPVRLGKMIILSIEKQPTLFPFRVPHELDPEAVNQC